LINFIKGDTPGFADYMTWPHIERCLVLPLIKVGDKLFAKFPKLTAYVEKMKARPEVKINYRSPEEHLKFMKSSVGGTPDYDMGCEWDNEMHILNNIVVR